MMSPTSLVWAFIRSLLGRLGLRRRAPVEPSEVSKPSPQSSQPEHWLRDHGATSGIALDEANLSTNEASVTDDLRDGALGTATPSQLGTAVLETKLESVPSHEADLVDCDPERRERLVTTPAREAVTETLAGMTQTVLTVAHVGATVLSDNAQSLVETAEQDQDRLAVLETSTAAIHDSVDITDLSIPAAPAAVAQALSAPCPQCGTTCPVEDEEAIFGFEVVKRTDSTSPTRRQSYCKSCRAQQPKPQLDVLDMLLQDDGSREGGAGVLLSASPQAGDDAPSHLSSGLENTLSVGVATDHQSDAADDPIEVVAAEAPQPAPRRNTKYRPPKSTLPPKPKAGGNVPEGDRTAAPGRSRSLPIEVRVLFQRGGTCQVSLLPRRPDEAPEIVRVQGLRDGNVLIALQDEWYGDLHPPNLGELLLSGVAVSEEDAGQVWLLSGREIFVLASTTTLSGYVSSSRLALGRSQCVLAVESRTGDVEAVLREAGCESWKTLTHEDGVPSGWLLFRDVVPTLPVASPPTTDILNTLRPAADIEIALEDGIRLDYSNWLEGNPPSIRVYGDPKSIGAPLIDAAPAVLEQSAGVTRLTAPGWDEVGDHQVWCNGVTRRYSLVTRAADPDFWPAYTFSPVEHRRPAREIAICGPLVREIGDPIDGGDVSSRLCAVPPTNPVILGANPGEILFLAKWNHATGAQRLGSVPFEPIWAVPLLPLLCDKATHRIKFIGNRDAAPPANTRFVNARERNALIRRWCVHVMDLGRKGILLESDEPDVVERWRRCRALARDTWRNRR